MSSRVVTYEVAGDTTVSFEMEPVAGFVPASGPGDVVGRVRTAMGPVVTAAKEILDQVKAIAPDEVEVKLGVKVTGTMNWVVAKAASEGNFEITLKWHRSSDTP